MLNARLSIRGVFLVSILIKIGGTTTFFVAVASALIFNKLTLNCVSSMVLTIFFLFVI